MRQRLGSWLYALGLLVAAGCIGYLAQRHAHVFDWSAGHRASLSAPTRAVLKRMQGPVRITSYVPEGSKLRATVAAFIARYHAVKPDLSLKFVDPDRNPGAMRKAGIQVSGELVVRYRGRQQHLRQLSDDSLTDALDRLARGKDRIVAFVTGDGERNPGGAADADLGQFLKPLAARGVRAVPLNFSQVSGVPQSTDLVVLASPVSALPESAVHALVGYVQAGGNMLWLSEPGDKHPELAPLVQALGVQPLPGMLVRAEASTLTSNDPRMLALVQYPENDITRDLDKTTVFSQVQALASTSDTQWSAKPLLRSGSQSWTDLQPVDTAHPGAIHFDADKGELHGPLDFGYALSRLSPTPDKNQQRAVVIGDGDFLSNALIGHAGNRALGERVLDWLLGDDALVRTPRPSAPDRVVHLSSMGLDLLAGVFMIALPLLLLLLGAGIAWRRRQR